MGRSYFSNVKTTRKLTKLCILSRLQENGADKTKKSIKFTVVTDKFTSYRDFSSVFLSESLITYET